MGAWLNVAFVQSADQEQVEKELSRLLTERGRRLTAPGLRTPAQYDPMQYGLGDEVQRWGVAGFQGAPGWTVLRAAPFELLMQGEPPLLARLAARLGIPAFQYNLYDSTPEFLLEVDAGGRVERSGFVGMDVTRYWGGEPPPDRFTVRFHLIDPSATASWSEAAMPEARVTGWLSSFDKAQERANLSRWLEEIGAQLDPGAHEWRVHPAHALRQSLSGGDAHSPRPDAGGGLRAVRGDLR